MRHLERLENRRLLSAYRLVDLGALGGNASVGYDINSKNQVVGSAQTAAGADRAFLFEDANANARADPGEMTDLGALAGHAGSYAYGLNDQGVVVGSSVDQSGNERAVIYQPGVGAADLGLGNGSNAYAINDAGDVVGAALFSVIRYAAFHRSASGNVTNLGTLASGLYGSSEAYGINSQGAIAGWASTDVGDSGFLRPDGRDMTAIGFTNAPPALAYGYAWDLNDQGHVVGEGFNAAGEYRAFLYDGIVASDLGVLPGFDSSMARGLNTRGDVVGILEPAAGSNHAFVFEDGVMKDLNDLIPKGSGWLLTEGRAINDSGAIVANGVSPTGEARAVLLIPDSIPPAVTSAQFQHLAAPRSLVFRFSEDVSASLGLEDLVVTNVDTNQPVSGLSHDYESESNTATFRFAADPADGNYRATLVADGVRDPAGLALDGEGDGSPGGDLHLDFFHLRGDANHDRTVNFADLVALAQNYNGSSGADWSQGDFDGDAAVGFTDLVALAQNYNKVLSEPATIAAKSEQLAVAVGAEHPAPGERASAATSATLKRGRAPTPRAGTPAGRSPAAPPPFGIRRIIGQSARRRIAALYESAESILQ